MTKTKTISLAVIVTIAISMFTIIDINAATNNFKPKITSFTCYYTPTCSNEFKGNLITNVQYVTHWTKKNWNKNYNKWKVQYRFKAIMPVKKAKKSKTLIETTSWINSNTFAKTQYFGRVPPRNCKITSKYSTKKQKPGYYCQIRFVKNNKYTEASNWHKWKKVKR